MGKKGGNKERNGIQQLSFACSGGSRLIHEGGGMFFFGEGANLTL